MIASGLDHNLFVVVLEVVFLDVLQAVLTVEIVRVPSMMVSLPCPTIT
jgi:hypothetical protein